MIRWLALPFFLLLSAVQVHGSYSRIVDLDTVSFAGGAFHPLTGDSCYWLSDTLSVPTAFIFFDATVSNIAIDGKGNHLYYNTSGSNGVEVFTWDHSGSNHPTLIRIYDFTAVTDTISGHGLPLSSTTFYYVEDARNVVVKDVNVEIDGHNVNIAYFQQYGTPDVTHSVDSFVIDGGTWRSYSESFSSRETSGSSVVDCDNLTAPSDTTHYNFEIKNVNFLRFPHHIVKAKARCWIHDNYAFWKGARNTYQDSIWLDKGFSAPIGSSADNNYFINCRGGDGLSIIEWNTFAVDTTAVDSGQVDRQGMRGILLENLENTSAAHPFIVRYNTLMLCTGPTGENPQSQGRGIRLRAIDGGSCAFALVYGNVMYLYGDVSSATAQIGSNYYGFEMGSGGSVHDNLIEHNTCFALCYSSSSSCNIDPVEFSGSNYESNNNVIRYNRWVGSQHIMRHLDDYNGIAVSNYYAEADTLEKVDTTVFSGVKIHNFATIWIGGDIGKTWSNIVYRDFAFAGGASYDDIVFASNNTAEVGHERTVTIRVENTGGSPVSGADVWAVNNYGDTVLTGTTDGTGTVSGAVSYWYEEDHIASAVDSTAYNDFTFGAAKSGDTTIHTYTVEWNVYTDTLVLMSATDTTLEIRDTVFSETADSAYVEVVLSVALADTLHFNWSTGDGTATQPEDYIEVASGTAVIPPGETHVFLSVDLVNDLKIEDPEGFDLTISSPDIGSIIDGVATVTINSEDVQTWDILDTVQTEPGTAVVRVLMRPRTYKATSDSCQYTTYDSTATQPVDYGTASGWLVFAPGDTIKSFNVTINSDGYEAVDEFIGTNIFNFSNGTGGDTNGKITIPANGTPPESPKIWIGKCWLGRFNF